MRQKFAFWANVQRGLSPDHRLRKQDMNTQFLFCITVFFHFSWMLFNGFPPIYAG